MAFAEQVQSTKDRMVAAEQQRYQAGEMPDHTLCVCGQIIRKSLMPVHVENTACGGLPSD